MSFIKGKVTDFYLHDSQIENIFINEYLPAAPGDFVKVYLFAYMYAEFGMEMTDKVIAKQLGVSEKKVAEAWTYWEEVGTIHRHYIGASGKADYAVEFLSLKELMYGSGETVSDSAEKQEAVFGDERFRELFDEIEQTMGRSLSSTEIRSVISWIMDDRIPPEIVTYGIGYCVEKGKNSFRYIESVIRRWTENGLYTVDEVNHYLEEIDQRFYQYRRVLQALGLTRNATEKEREMMDRWFDVYGYSMDRVLDAVGKTTGITNPNFSYVNKVLENWKEDAKRRGDNDVNKKITVTQAQLKEYYLYLRERSERDAENRTQEVYAQIPRIREIDQRMQQLGTALSKALIEGRESEVGAGINKERDDLEEERAVLLTDHNFELDYTDKRYFCNKCHDTGITDMGEPCSCRGKRMEEAEIWLKQKAGMENGKEN